jgi:predicted Zn-dependent protease
MQRGDKRGIVTRFLAARRARAAFTKALERDSTRVDALESLAWLARLLPALAGGSTADADLLLRKLEIQSPYRAALMRGYFARASGGNLAAETAFRQLVVTAPDSAPAWFALGDLSYRLGKADVALEALRKYAQLMPGDRTTLFYLGQVAAVHGVGLAEAEVSLRDYLRGPNLLTQPRPELGWWRLGQVLEKLGKVAPAREAYRKAIAIDSRDEDFQKSLRLLDVASVLRP